MMGKWVFTRFVGKPVGRGEGGGGGGLVIGLETCTEIDPGLTHFVVLPNRKPAQYKYRS